MAIGGGRERTKAQLATNVAALDEKLGYKAGTKHDDFYLMEMNPKDEKVRPSCHVSAV